MKLATSEKQKLLEEQWELNTKILTIKNPMKQITEHIKVMGEFFERIWKKGYDRGYAAGKKDWVKKDLNQN